jgi:uncharacterized membrane protein HdeD (DUF308 family)
MMANVLKQAWWMLLVRGIVAILFALLLLFAPGLTLTTGALSFALLFAAYALIEGASTIVGAIRKREGQWFLLVIFGVISILAGLIVLANPLLFSVLTVAILIYVVAFKSIAGGIVEMISAWQLRKEIDNEWLLFLNGVLGLLFGLILLRRPITGVEVLVLFVAFYLLVSGVIQIVLAFRVRGWAGKLAEGQAAAQA